MIKIWPGDKSETPHSPGDEAPEYFIGASCWNLVRSGKSVSTPMDPITTAQSLPIKYSYVPLPDLSLTYRVIIHTYRVPLPVQSEF